MKRLLLALAILVALLPVADARMTTVVVGGGVTSDYCSTQSWNTLTNFRLDFDNTVNTSAACLLTEVSIGSLTGASITGPTPASPGSRGNAILNDGDSQKIAFDNDSAFSSQYGELYFKIMTVGDNTVPIYPVKIEAVAIADRLFVYFSSLGRLYVLWEDNNKSNSEADTLIGALDLDSYYGKWVQVHVKWDTTQCTAGDGNCGGIKEIGARYRVDANADGDFNDGGVEDWSAFTYESSAYDLEPFSSEPGDGEIVFCVDDPSNGSSWYVDDIEISTSQPSTMDN